MMPMMISREAIGSGVRDDVGACVTEKIAKTKDTREVIKRQVANLMLALCGNKPINNKRCASLRDIVGASARYAIETGV